MKMMLAVLALLLVVCLGFALAQAGRKAGRAGTYRRRKLMTDNELEFFDALFKALPEHYSSPKSRCRPCLSHPAASLPAPFLPRPFLRQKCGIEGENREQGTLLPEHLDDYVGADKPVRVVDVFVDALDLGSLGFERVQPAKTGRLEAKLEATGETQVSLTDPDARSMITRGAGIVGYNVQTAVDAKHHVIVEHEVTNVGSDRDQLSGMATKARDAIGTTTLTAIADRGDFKGEDILACREAGITARVPATKTSNAKADGRFDKADFVYDQQKNEYRCPAGQALIWRFASVEKGMTNHRYWSSNCKGCPFKEKCTPGQQRLTTGLARVKTEMSLHVLAYNLKRLLALPGIATLMDAIWAQRSMPLRVWTMHVKFRSRVCS